MQFKMYCETGGYGVRALNKIKLEHYTNIHVAILKKIMPSIAATVTFLRLVKHIGILLSAGVG